MRKQSQKNMAQMKLWDWRTKDVKKVLWIFVLACAVTIGCTACGVGNQESENVKNVEHETNNIMDSETKSVDVNDLETEGITESSEIAESFEIGGGEPISDLFLDKNGIITEGGMWFQTNPYSETKPMSVTKNEDGSYRCQVSYVDEAYQEYFLIYPEGTIGENPYIYNDPFLTENPYIQYMLVDGGVMDIIYYKVEE